MLVILNDNNFEEETKQGLILVDFYAEWCGPCRMLTPVLEELSKELELRVKIVKINIDDSPDTASKYSVSSIPTIILLEDGKEVNRVVGLKDKDFLKNMIEKQLN